MMSPPATTSLRAPWLQLARAAWIILTVACLCLFVSSFYTLAQTNLLKCLGVEAACNMGPITGADLRMAEQMNLPFPFLATSLAVSTAARLSLVLVAIIIFWRRSNDWVAMVLSASLVTALIEGGAGFGGWLNILVAILFSIGGLLFTPLPFVFPNGRCEPRWMRWLVLPLSLVYPCTTLIAFFAPQWSGANLWLTVVWSMLALYAMIYRYRRVSNAIERQQTKWVLLGVSASLIVGLDYTITLALFPVSQPSPERILALILNISLYFVGYIFFAASIGIAVLRYRLWDIDILIRRTLVYTALSVLLAITYFGLVIILQSIFTLFGGERSELINVISTLAIAALFFPLRRRIQDFIDQRFYRRKYDAIKTLADFAATARDETDLDELTARLVSVVDETVQPMAIRLFLKDK
jgi:hypothetical protein